MTDGDRPGDETFRAGDYLVCLPLYFVVPSAWAMDPADVVGAEVVTTAGLVRAVLAFTDADLVTRFIRESGRNLVALGYRPGRDLLEFLGLAAEAPYTHVSVDPGTTHAPTFLLADLVAAVRERVG